MSLPSAFVPTRGRGLKPKTEYVSVPGHLVRPHAGARIETLDGRHTGECVARSSPRGGAD